MANHKLFLDSQKSFNPLCPPAERIIKNHLNLLILFFKLSKGKGLSFVTKVLYLK